MTNTQIINKILKSANNEGSGWFYSGRNEVQIDFNNDETEIVFEVSYVAVSFKGRVKETKTTRKIVKMSELDETLTDEALAMVEDFKTYYANL